MGKVGQIFRKGLYDNVKNGVEENSGTFLISYSALSTSQLGEFRRKMEELGVKIYVSKNRIAQLALKELKYDSLAEEVEAQTAFAWTNNDVAEISKSLVKFEKDFEGLRIKGGVLSGAILKDADVKRLADLPSKEILRSQLLGIIVAPLTRLAGALNAKSRDLLSILKQYSEQKGGS